MDLSLILVCFFVCTYLVSIELQQLIKKHTFWNSEGSKNGHQNLSYWSRPHLHGLCSVDTQWFVAGHLRWIPDSPLDWCKTKAEVGSVLECISKRHPSIWIQSTREKSLTSEHLHSYTGRTLKKKQDQRGLIAVVLTSFTVASSKKIHFEDLV